MHYANAPYGNAPYANEPYNQVGGASKPYCGGYNNGFALIVVLFLLLIIVGAAYLKC